MGVVQRVPCTTMASEIEGREEWGEVGKKALFLFSYFFFGSGSGVGGRLPRVDTRGKSGFPPWRRLLIWFLGLRYASVSSLRDVGCIFRRYTTRIITPKPMYDGWEPRHPGPFS